jgi:hypothetical protein
LTLEEASFRRKTRLLDKSHQRECHLREGKPFIAKYAANILLHSEEQQTKHLGF